MISDSSDVSGTRNENEEKDEDSVGLASEFYEEQL